jgi:hypothetical protein
VISRRGFLAVLAGAVACPALPKPVPRVAPITYSLYGPSTFPMFQSHVPPATGVLTRELLLQAFDVLEPR